MEVLQTTFIYFITKQKRIGPVESLITARSQREMNWITGRTKKLKQSTGSAEFQDLGLHDWLY